MVEELVIDGFRTRYAIKNARWSSVSVKELGRKGANALSLLISFVKRRYARKPVLYVLLEDFFRAASYRFSTTSAKSNLSIRLPNS